jgi:hypothetical protein
MFLGQFTEWRALQQKGLRRIANPFLSIPSQKIETNCCCPYIPSIQQNVSLFLDAEKIGLANEEDKLG